MHLQAMGRELLRQETLEKIFDVTLATTLPVLLLGLYVTLGLNNFIVLRPVFFAIAGLLALYFYWSSRRSRPYFAASTVGGFITLFLVCMYLFSAR